MLAALLIGAALPARADDKPKERLGLDPVIQGIWTLVATSTDKGKTIEPVDPPEAFCQATATKLKFADGTVRNVERVFIVKDDNGNPGNVAFLDNGIVFMISKQKGSPFVLVQVMDADLETEKVRFLMVVKE